MADAVVIARVTEETRLPAPRSETAAGDGVDLVGRSVTLEIDKVLWREKSTSTEPRGSITLNVSGWLSDGKTDREVVTGARSRLEVGHTYVVAMSWMRAECDEGDPVQPAGWEPIGGGGVLPADDGVIGRGEYLGAMVDRPDQGDVPSGSVLAATTGRSPDDVVSLLEDTEPVKRIDVQADLRPCNE
ncbi:MAG: hypothetical protein EON52_06105 [Actinomycetales bacterium]|nr:MAG: hypothetical protein EON52_06105 [Actinomycetales bacterium]